MSTFDDIGQSLLAVFQMVTQDNWTAITYNLMDASLPFIASFYSSLLIIICAFFLINLILAVIIEAFNQVLKSDLEEETEQQDHEEEE